MKKLYLKLITLTMIVITIATVLFVGIFFGVDGIYNNNFQKGYVYQYRALQRADKNRPKILVIGGSYMTFAVDSKKLSDISGMPVYTLGINSGMGMSYIFETAKEFINKNDIVIFPFLNYTTKEYGMGLIYISLDGEDDMFWKFFKSHPFEIIKTAGNKIYDKLWGIMSYLKWKGKNEDGMYCAASFDIHTGNIIHKREKPELSNDKIEKIIKYNIKDVSNGVFEEINEFDLYCKSKGAKLYMTFAPALKDSVASTNKELNVYQEELANRINAPFISKLTDCLVPYKFIFDSLMHLDDEGVDYYSRKLYYDLVRIKAL